MRLVLVIFIALTVSAVAQGLEFEETRLEIEVPEGSGRTDVEFRFTNTSEKTINIRRAPASCNCVAGQEFKRDFAPGESGTIPFSFRPRRAWGTRFYKIYVSTDESGVAPYRLQLVVTETKKETPAAP